ncbi:MULTISPECIES: amino acid permease [unclassified Chromobacterium]|uniref:amino acid permease n=1 Tax=unclassified Chromobacterium TaxID=2641838 RepID=UPI001F347E4D|nr:MULTISPECIES: amino acid permease [unclassified Chromobacterium]MCP1291513.1 amino acid permease [Chromobacterium sp. S0633]
MEPVRHESAPVGEDEKLLHSMGYAQELSRRMSGFSNFAISFSIICVLAGGITAFPAGLSAGGGAAIGIGWPLGALFAAIVAAAMAQIASAYPTAGGLYHWASILGGKGLGWTTAWINLLGLIFVTAAVNFGVYDPFFKTLVAPLLGLNPEQLGWGHQTLFLAVVALSQAWLNHLGIKLTTRLTDLSGYLIFVVTLALVVSLLIYAPGPLDFSRLWTFHNYSGADGGAWPRMDNTVMVFLAGLLLTVYTLTGYDASAHTSEETREAARNVPKGILRSVLWSGVFGYLMICAFVLVLPDLGAGVKAGMGFFDLLLSALPPALKAALGIGIFLVNYLCGLACLTSTSRMMYAFARDGGLPASRWLRQVHPQHRTPGPAIWVSAALAIAATLYGDAFLVLSTGAAVFLYISYILPSAAGLFAEGRSWTHKGPFDLGRASKPIAALATLGGAVLVFVGIQPPNEKVLYLTVALLLVLALFWFALGVRKQFKGPPTGQRIQGHQAHIREIESALDEAG